MSRNTVSSLTAVGILVAGTLCAGDIATRPGTFGTGLSLYRVGSTEFTPIDTSVTYNDLGNVSATLSRYVTGCATLCELLAVPHLPSGALVTGVDVVACDTNAAGNHLTLIAFTSSWDGTGGTNIGETTTSNVGGCTNWPIDLAPANFTIDNFTNQLFFGAFFGALNGTNSLSGVIVHYQLQVSPAPGSPSFNDVPTSHPFFQYIEALKASGITGGCQVSPPLFCPNNPVTRGQMAVFLAKALGLQWF